VLVVGVGGGCLTVSSGLSFFVKVFAVSATGIATGLVLSVCTFDEMVGDFECNPICRRQAGWAVSMLGSRTPDEAQSSEYSVGMNSWGFVGTFRPFRPLASFRSKNNTSVSSAPSATLASRTPSEHLAAASRIHENPQQERQRLEALECTNIAVFCAPCDPSNSLHRILKGSSTCKANPLADFPVPHVSMPSLPWRENEFHTLTYVVEVLSMPLKITTDMMSTKPTASVQFFSPEASTCGSLTEA